MQDVVFVDTGFFLALVNEDDDFHADAEKLHAALKNVLNKIRLIFTDYVFDEVMTGLRKSKVEAGEIAKFGDDLLSSRYYTRSPISEAGFREAWKMFKKCKDKKWSFTDCTSFVVMNELGIKFHLSFDEHFDQAKFQAWQPARF